MLLCILCGYGFKVGLKTNKGHYYDRLCVDQNYIRVVWAQIRYFDTQMLIRTQPVAIG